MLNNMTIVTSLLPNIGREDSFNRFVEYHSNYCKVIVVLTFDNPIRESDYPHIVFIRCENDKIDYYKIDLALKQVDTPYVAWVNDDDFIGFDFVNKAIGEMDNNENIVACDGLSIFFNEIDVKRVQPLYTFIQYKKGLSFQKRDRLKDENAFRFYGDHFNAMIFHGVYRKEVLSKTVKVCLELKKPIRWDDNIFIGYVLTQGEIKYIKSISGIRSADTRIMDCAPSYYIDSQIQKKELILDNESIEYIENTAIKKHGKLTSQMRASILYYFIFSSGALKSSSKLNKLAKLFYKIASLSEFQLMCLSNRHIKKDIMEIQSLMKKYPIEPEKV